MEVTTGPTNIIYRVDDRTGPWVKVQKWVSDQDPAEEQERMTCQEGMYVRIVGHLKVFNKQRSVTAFYVKPQSDFNQLSHHLSEVMFAHLVATKGAQVVRNKSRGGRIQCLVVTRGKYTRFEGAFVTRLVQSLIGAKPRNNKAKSLVCYVTQSGHA